MGDPNSNKKYPPTTLSSAREREDAATTPGNAAAAAEAVGTSGPGTVTIQVHTTNTPRAGQMDLPKASCSSSSSFATPLRPMMTSRPLAPVNMQSMTSLSLAANMAATVQPLTTNASKVMRISAVDSVPPPAVTSAALSVRQTVGGVTMPSLSMPLGSATMASIIRTPHSHVQQGPNATSHIAAHTTVSAPPYSSHVPRGPAAVASITPPRSAVATPILRPPLGHPQAVSAIQQTGLAVTTTMHSPLQPRAQVLSTLRSASPASPKSIACTNLSTQVTDVHRPSALQGNANTVQVSSHPMPSQPRVENLFRSTIPHSSGIQKPVHISTPIMQPVQLTDRNLYKSAAGNNVTAMQAHTILPNQQPSSVPPSSQAVASVGGGGNNQSFTTAAGIPPPNATITFTAATAHLPTFPPISHPQVVVSQQHLHGPTPPAATAGQMQISASPSRNHVGPPPSSLHIHQQPKIIPQAVHTVAPIQQQPPTITVTSAASGRPNMGIHGNHHTTSVTVTQQVPRLANSTTIPVAKVHPQPLPGPTRGSLDAAVDSGPVNLLIPSQSHRASPNLPPSGNSVAAMPTSVVLMETQQERSIQPTTPYTLNTYFYDSGYALQSYGGQPTAHAFPAISSSSAIRPNLMPNSHQSQGITATVQATNRSIPANQNMNPIMVTMETNRPLTLHTSYTSTAEGNATSTDTTAAPSATVVYTVSSSAGSNIITTVSGSNNYNTATTTSQVLSAGTSPSQVINSSRPSILRKRTNNDSSVAVVKRNLVPSFPCVSEPASPHVDSGSSNSIISTTSSPKPSSEVIRENGVGANHQDNNEGGLGLGSQAIKQELVDLAETCIVSTSLGTSLVEASPRKKPRKQQLTGNELLETHSTDVDDDVEQHNRDKAKNEIVREDKDGVRWVASRVRPPITLLNSYRHTWKSRHNHFLRWTDVKPKEKRATVSDLSNQKAVLQKINGWKLFHLCTQMDEVVEVEDNVNSRLSELLKITEKRCKKNDDDNELSGEFNKVTEFVKGNMQRSKAIRDQMQEARQQVTKVLDHKPHIVDIVSKHINKRPIKKRDKN